MRQRQVFLGLGSQHHLFQKRRWLYGGAANAAFRHTGLRQSIASDLWCGIDDQRNFLGNHNPKRAFAPALQQLSWRNLTICRFITTKKKYAKKIHHAHSTGRLFALVYPPAPSNFASLQRVTSLHG